MHQAKRIALLLGQELGYCRNVLRGIQKYAIQKSDWVFHDESPSLQILDALTQWEPHGIIALIYEQRLADALMKLNVPLINTTSTLSQLPLPLVEVDHQKIGHLAAEYLLSKGFQNFGYFGSAWTGVSKGREAGFRQVVEAQGFQINSCYSDYLPRPPAEQSWKVVDEQIQQWLLQLPKPVAIFASNDVPARYLVNICGQLELKIPEDVSVLGVDNDEFECRFARPPISSIAIPAEQIGYLAAKMLEQLMEGQPIGQLKTFLPPVRIVTRQSTDSLAIDNPDVSMALSFIRDRAAENIAVDDVAKHVCIGRRVLERGFRKTLGRSVLDEIRRVRIELAKELLSDTDYSMPLISQRSGFNSARRLAVVFRQQTGSTPTAYRRQSQVRE